MKSLVYQKLKVARESIWFSQSAVMREIGYKQSGLSALEAGRSTYIPNKYLAFLVLKKVDVNGIFDENISLPDYEGMCYGKIKKPQSETEACGQCAVKDREISMLRDHLEDLKTILRPKVPVA